VGQRPDFGPVTQNAPHGPAPGDGADRRDPQVSHPAPSSFPSSADTSGPPASTHSRARPQLVPLFRGPPLSSRPPALTSFRSLVRGAGYRNEPPAGVADGRGPPSSGRLPSPCAHGGRPQPPRRWMRSWRTQDRLGIVLIRDPLDHAPPSSHFFRIHCAVLNNLAAASAQSTLRRR
jgi:hypothetical protein